MSTLHLVVRSLRYHWRTGLLVAFAVCVATAVITGSLLVGQSVTGSIRDTALARLGRTTHALVAPGLFGDHLAAAFRSAAAAAAPLLLTRGAVRSDRTEATAPNVTVVGADASFAAFYDRPVPTLLDRKCAVNASLARDLGLKPDDVVLLTVGRQANMPIDSLFTRRKRAETTRTLRLEVSAILADEGPGGFGLDAGTATPRNLFVSRAWLAEALQWEGRANALLVAARDRDASLAQVLAASCTVGDLGLRTVASPGGGYVALQSSGFVLDANQVEAARRAAAACGARAERTSVYLATRIRASRAGEVPYAMVAGLEGEGDPGPGGIVLNRWAAQDLGAARGQTVEVEYLVPAADGTYLTRSARFVVRGTAEMAGLGADPRLTPQFEGLTDARHMGDWSAPFPVDLSRIGRRDEAYWDRYRAAPRAFISLQAARALWQQGPQGTAADWVTSVRVYPAAGRDLTSLQSRFALALRSELSPAQAGLVFRPVRRLALAAAQGSTDFTGLFLGLGSFLVLAAAALAAMTMRLAAERRAAQAGLLLAVGLTPAHARRVAFGEGACLTLIGALLGGPMGVAYAAWVLHALTTRWSGAVADAAVWLHMSPAAVAGGIVAGAVVGLLSVAWGVRGLTRRPVLALLAGWQAVAVLPRASGSGRKLLWLLALLATAAVLAGLSLPVHVVPVTAAFFGIGLALLAAGLLGVDIALARTVRTAPGIPSRGLLAARNAAVNRGHSLLAVGLMACAAFILAAVAANVRDYGRLDTTDRASGSGGFSLVATGAIALTADPGTPAGRRDLGFAPDDEAAFAGAEVVPFLMTQGDDVSCLNLARPMAPRVLGVSGAMVARGGFTVATLASAPGGDPWRLLERPLADGAVPVFGDSESVQWILHSGLGQTISLPAEGGAVVRARFVGLVRSSIFAGSLLMAEPRFRALYPGVRAPRTFLISTAPGREAATAEALRRNLGDAGVEVRSTREVLNALIRVQNGYLSSFLALGGMGLVLGTIGMGTVLLRSALERRPEFALLLATGFTRRDVAGLLVAENGALLLAGLVGGTAAALIAVAPHLLSASARADWRGLSVLLAAIAATGLLSCTVAGAAAVRGRLLDALRSE